MSRFYTEKLQTPTVQPISEDKSSSESSLSSNMNLNNANISPNNIKLNIMDPNYLVSSAS